MSRTYNLITAFAPASTSNLGSGFDVFGLAIEGPGDYVTIKRNNREGLRITKITGDKGRLSTDPEQNTIGVALKAFFNALYVQPNFDLQLRKGMPLGSGMGSSAASAVAAVMAANELLGRPLPKADLVQYAMQGERVASGSVHADNVAPSMLGGFTLIRSMDPFEVLTLPVPRNLNVVILHPHVEVRTIDARNILPDEIPLKLGVQQWANTAALVKGIYENDTALIGRSMEDMVAEPYRRALIPGFDETKDAALRAGAFGCCISGAGPSILALCKNAEIAARVGREMKSVMRKIKVDADVLVTRADRKGARITERK